MSDAFRRVQEGQMVYVLLLTIKAGGPVVSLDPPWVRWDENHWLAPMGTPAPKLSMNLGRIERIEIDPKALLR